MSYLRPLSTSRDGIMDNRPAGLDRPLNGKRVLLVDDDAELITVLRAYLEDQGLMITEAGTARQALHVLHDRGPYDLVLLDIGLPDTDGLDVLERLRQEGYDRPVIMATADSTPAKLWRARQLGAAAYLTKPFEFDKLTQFMTHILATP